MQPTRQPAPAGPGLRDPELAAPELQSVRARRAELRATLAALEQALAAPAQGREDLWGVGVRESLATLVTDFAEHVRVTEGSDGLHQAITTAAPRLIHAVRQLTDEHSRIAAELAELTSLARPPLGRTEVEVVRTKATRLLGGLARHRQRGADLIYEAYETDIGGTD
ncbi:MAG TPA: hypothetical protein VGL26_01575 [Jatrophihabitans sp.]|jgi:ABC-type transporter Mla subunit MlaD